jgi:hypothetical protein
MESARKAEPGPDLGVWDAFIYHDQNMTEMDARVRDLIGGHKISVCSKWSFASVGEGGVKRPIQQCNK